MAKHINHFDCQNKVANTFKTISTRNSDTIEDLSLQAQLEAEKQRKKQLQNKPTKPIENKRRWAGWVVVKHKRNTDVLK